MFGLARAPDFDHPGLTWLNVAQPLDLAALRGRLVVLDFWTFCCINCFHAQPTLRRLQQSFPAELVVIGVHSPKFTHEQSPAAALEAIRRYHISHPVIHDPFLTLWDRYCVRAWPTLVIISPTGQVVGQMAGEPDAAALTAGITSLLDRFWRQGSMMPTLTPPYRPRSPERRLRHPGRIKPVPGPGARRWAIADTGHHQIVLADDHGHELARWGRGRAGLRDGGAMDCAFDGPEGLVCDRDAIFVADTRNHAIRCIDLSDGAVSTLAGLGCRGAVLEGEAAADQTALASPWDLELLGQTLYFSNAGSHQIGALDLTRRTVRPAAGCGAEDLADGPALDAVLAQPSGLALCPSGSALYFTDAESSSVRRLTLDHAPRVETLTGAGLFAFGLQDGPLHQARLQHPLGLAVHDGRIVVADSYNSVLRRLDLAAGHAETVDLSGDGDRPLLFEPAAVASAGPDRLLVADTNHHRILEVHPTQARAHPWMA